MLNILIVLLNWLIKNFFIGYLTVTFCSNSFTYFKFQAFLYSIYLTKLSEALIIIKLATTLQHTCYCFDSVLDPFFMWKNSVPIPTFHSIARVTRTCHSIYHFSVRFICHLSNKEKNGWFLCKFSVKTVSDNKQNFYYFKEDKILQKL